MAGAAHPHLTQPVPHPHPQTFPASHPSVQGSSCCPRPDLEWQAGAPRPTLSPTWIRTASPSTDPVSRLPAASHYLLMCVFIYSRLDSEGFAVLTEI